MVASVKFNGERSFGAIKIEKVFSNGIISAKFIGTELPIAKPPPEAFFRPSGLFSQSSGAVSLALGHAEK